MVSRGVVWRVDSQLSPPLAFKVLAQLTGELQCRLFEEEPLPELHEAVIAELTLSSGATSLNSDGHVLSEQHP